MPIRPCLGPILFQRSRGKTHVGHVAYVRQGTRCYDDVHERDEGCPLVPPEVLVAVPLHVWKGRGELLAGQYSVVYLEEGGGVVVGS